MRYEAEWLLECLLLRVKSKAAYKHIRDSGMLPLPSLETLRKLIGGLSCHFGFNDMALEAIGKAFANMPEKDRLGSLSFDEIAIMEEITFNEKDFCFDGFVNCPEYGLDKDDDDECESDEDDDEVEEIIIEEGNVSSETEASSDNKKPIDATENPAANHALVLMFRPLKEDLTWVQPLAVFPSRNAASGELLHRILIKAIMTLQHYGANVTSVVCDGAQTNKTVWRKCGIGIFGDKVVNKMSHPGDPDKDIHFMSDPPHIFKCIRNQMLDSTVQVTYNNQYFLDHSEN